MDRKIFVDVVLGIALGDEGKGKICHALSMKNPYTHVMRFSGGGNAGHTIYHEGKKFATHLLPCGFFNKIKSVIGPGCVVNPNDLFLQINHFENNGFDVKSYLKIAKNTHIVTENHLLEDSKDTKIGTTKTGNGPAYRDKYNRTGIRAEEVPELKPFLIDMYEEFYDGKVKYVLAEGAQAFFLDPDWGDYPYVTSSHCGIGSVLLNGFSHEHINDVYGIVKAYETYVGNRKFEPDEPIFSEIRKLGQEFGTTTGRARQCNWLNLDRIIKAIQMNGVNTLIVNKIDILRQLNVWNIIHENKVKNFNNENDFVDFIFNKTGTKVIFF